jgi:hypothetical protein
VVQSSNPDRITPIFGICLEEKKIQIEFNSTEHFLYVIIRMVQTARLYLSVRAVAEPPLGVQGGAQGGGYEFMFFFLLFFSFSFLLKIFFFLNFFLK